MSHRYHRDREGMVYRLQVLLWEKQSYSEAEQYHARGKNVWLKKASCKGVVCSLFLTYLSVAHINELTHLPPRQKSFHFADIFKCISMNEKFCISILISLNLFERVQLTVSQQWFKQWLGGEQATSHYLNRCCPVHWHIYTALGEMS